CGSSFYWLRLSSRDSTRLPLIIDWRPSPSTRFQAEFPMGPSSPSTSGIWATRTSTTRENLSPSTSTIWPRS
ncbi:hypothetical protein PMAYCL1PPCAC_08555, partial [Pristionchus mayeri]